MGITAFEKIVSKHLLRTLSDGTMVIRADKKFCHEITFPPHINRAKKLGYDVVQDPNTVFMMIDHVSPPKDQKTALQGKILRGWSKEHIVTFFDTGQGGIGHVLNHEKGLIGSGETAIMGDSHTCTYGALGAFSMGVGTTDIGCGVVVGFFLLRPQEVIRVNFIGKLPPNVYAKDCILILLKVLRERLGKGGAANMVIEFGGNIVENMSMAARFTMCNMPIEGGATCGMVAVDMTTINYLWPAIKDKYASKENALKDLSRWNSDLDCEYDDTIIINISNFNPVTTINYHPSEVEEVSRLSGERIDQVVIGSCTNGRLEDLRIAAAIIKKIGGKVKVRTIVIPATSHIQRQAIKEGLISIFLDADCCVPNPSCGPCLGTSCGVINSGEVCLTTTNRNYSGRMGKGGMVHLSSPATAAYSAMMGEIIEPPANLCAEINSMISIHDEAAPHFQEKRPIPKIDYRELSNSHNVLFESKTFSGRPYYLPKPDVNTDEIISADHLDEVDEESFGQYCFEVLIKDPKERERLYQSDIIIGDFNFGEGSSREQAPWALKGANIECIIAKSFARIFERNFFNNALLAIQLPAEIVDKLFEERPDHIEVFWDTSNGEPGFIVWGDAYRVGFQISELQKNTIRKGGSVGVMLELAAELQEEGKI